MKVSSPTVTTATRGSPLCARANAKWRSAVQKSEVLFHQLVERHRGAAARADLRRRRATAATVEVELDVDEPLLVEPARGARVGRVERLDRLPLEEVRDQVRL